MVFISKLLAYLALLEIRDVASLNVVSCSNWTERCCWWDRPPLYPKRHLA